MRWIYDLASLLKNYIVYSYSPFDKSNDQNRLLPLKICSLEKGYIVQFGQMSLE